MLTRRLFTLASFAATSATAAGLCIPTARAAAADTLTIGRAASAATLDPGFLREPATLVDNVFDTLVSRDKDMKLAPGLALGWKSLDETTWEFTLRPGVTFQNGEKFTAESVKFSLERVLAPAAKAPTISYINTIASVETVGDLVVHIHTKGPDPLLPTRMSRYPAYIVPPDYVRRVGATTFARQPIGTGPYRVTEFVADDHVTMQAWLGHWRGAPAIATVIWRAIPEPTARTAALLAGEVQLVEGVPVALVPSLQSAPGLAVQRVHNGGLIIYLGLKSQEGPLADVRVRRALSLAIDRKGITSELLQGFATPTGGQVGPFDFGYKPTPVPPLDPEQAKKLLAEAGYAKGFDIRMQAPAHYLSSAEVGQVIAQQLGAVGVRVQLEAPEWSVYAQEVPAGKQAPIYMLAWGSTQTLDADAAIFPIYHSGQPYSTAAFPELDKLLDESRRVVDPAARAAVFAKIQELAADLVPTLPLHQEDLIYAQSEKVHFTGRPDARIPLFDIRLAA